jgi:hypothetical protein
MWPLTRPVDHAISSRSFIVLLLTGFATFALVLVSLGINGLLSYSVTRRTQEIGIRMALRAQGERVRRQIVMETLGRAAIRLAPTTVAAGWRRTRSAGLLHLHRFGADFESSYSSGTWDAGITSTSKTSFRR